MVTRWRESHTVLRFPHRPPRSGFWAHAPAAKWVQIVLPLLAVSGLLFDIAVMLVVEPNIQPGLRVLQLGIAVLYTIGLILLPYAVTWATVVIVLTAFISVPWSPPDVPASTLALTMGFVIALTPRAFITTFAAVTLVWAIVVLGTGAGTLSLMLIFLLGTAGIAGIGYAVRRILVDHADSAARTKQLRAELADAAVQQRRLIAHDLHDVVAHHITVIRMVSNMGLRAAGGRNDAELLETIGASAATALEELRRLLRVLDPSGGSVEPDSGVSDSRLATQIEHVATDLRTAGVSVVIDVVEDADRGVPEAVTISLGRILIEATTNVLKHGDATGCVIRVERGDRSILLEVINNIGASPQRPGGDASGYGVPGMRRRAYEVDGRVTAGASGTRWVVRADIPLS